MASAAGTVDENVDILKITEVRRRAGSVRVETQVWCYPLVKTDTEVVPALTWAPVPADLGY